MSEQANPTNGHVDLAAYLMDLLTPEQRVLAEEHLGGCTDCRDEVESLREWSAALTAIPQELLLDGPPDDADLLLQRTLREVRGESRRRVSRRTAMSAGIAAAVIAAAVAGGALIGRGLTPRPVTQAQPSASAPAGTRSASAMDPGTGARITAAVQPAAGWVRVSATVGGIPAGERCHLEIVARDGTATLAGGWLVSAAGEANGTTLSGSALVDPAQVASVRVVNEAGKQFVTAAV
jgi:hypothetical protein